MHEKSPDAVAVKTVSSLTVFGLLPEFLGRDASWYAEQTRRLRKEPLANPLLRENILTLQSGAKALLPELLRRLDAFGYEKVLAVGRFGEFAHRGGIVDIFPINAEQPFRIELSGNRIEEIVALDVASDLDRSEWEKIVRRAIEGPLEALRSGEYLVHLDHGIGRFRGRRTLTLDGEERTYLVVEYARGDKIYVPENLTQRKLSRYVGFAEPTIHRLGTTAWLATKRRVRKDAKRFAEELLRLYAKRTIARRPPYRVEDDLLDRFIASFPHEETPDQRRAWHDTLRDLSHDQPMDRLLAGDVGFGKTELALRAAVVVALNGGQTAFLAPTTVLAEQHFRTSRERLEAIGIRAALLTRLQKPKEQRRILAETQKGAFDLLIGTHRLLSHDVAFKNLRLLVVDEEQRFGVKQKEAFKSIRGDLDVLSLSATPIPRTLAQVLADVRPVSRLQTAPRGRKEIATHFGSWNGTIVREALCAEQRRGGQSYVLHNRIATIAQFVRKLRALAPELRFGIIHGRVGESALLSVMQKLREGKIDVLVTTTIIENGLDLANVNTLIVEDATKLGLAQAYQLRGRIGRGAAQAYAYFFWPFDSTRGKRRPSEKAKERLAALQEATALGSAWLVALRDLEIRGAGSFLGREQSGLVNRVGFNLYAQLLAEAVETLRREKMPGAEAPGVTEA